MMIKQFALLVAACATATVLAAAGPKITLTGKAQSCYPGTPVQLVGVGGVNVSAFQVSKVPLLMTKLKALDTTTLATPASAMRLDTLAWQTDSLAKNSVALARVVSDSTGSFKVTIPVTDSVVIYGVARNEDDPKNQVYATISGRANKSFVLDLSRGGCGP